MISSETQSLECISFARLRKSNDQDIQSARLPIAVRRICSQCPQDRDTVWCDRPLFGTWLAASIDYLGVIQSELWGMAVLSCVAVTCCIRDDLWWSTGDSPEETIYIQSLRLSIYVVNGNGIATDRQRVFALGLTAARVAGLLCSIRAWINPVILGSYQKMVDLSLPLSSFQSCLHKDRRVTSISPPQDLCGLLLSRYRF